jgi:hypothetical protein
MGWDGGAFGRDLIFRVWSDTADTVQAKRETRKSSKVIVTEHR